MEQKAKPTILIMIDWFLPGTRSGGPVRSYANLIAHLEEEFHFKVITRDTDYCEEVPYPNIQANAWNPISPNTDVYYISKEELNGKTIKKLIQTTEHDTLYINGVYSRFFSILPLRYADKKNKKVIVAARGMLNPQAFSVKAKRKRLFLNIAKYLGLYKNTYFHATNEEEKEYISSINNKIKVLVAPNLPRKTVQQKSESKPCLEEGIKLVSIGRISVEKGTLKLLQSLAGINATGKKVALDLYGPIYDEAYWEKCKQIITQLPSMVRVNYKGAVESELIPEILKSYHFFTLFSEGENFGHAILEGLSAGCPVIISQNTPWKGLEQHQVGWDIDTSDITNGTGVFNKLALMDMKEYQVWSQNAYDYANQFCEQPELIAANKKLLSSLSKP
ncbi:hypothetical protein GCM10028791_39110 [Echinicola sediminis]